MKTRYLFLLSFTVVAGCGNDNTSAPPDMRRPADMRSAGDGGAKDMATAGDGGVTNDMSATGDMSAPQDFGLGDLALLPDGSVLPDGTVASDLSVIPDASAPLPDSAVVPDLTVIPVPDAVMLPDLLGVNKCKVVVNELQVAGTTDMTSGANIEAVELYNTTPTQECDLSGFSIVYRSAMNLGAANDPTKDSSTPCKIPQGTTMKPNMPYYVCASSTFLGAADQRWTSSSGFFSGSAGGVGVRDNAGALQDSVGYSVNGAIVTNLFVETAPAAMTSPTTMSIQRHPNGTDSNDNSKDFVEAAYTFGAANN